MIMTPNNVTVGLRNVSSNRSPDHRQRCASRRLETAAAIVPVRAMTAHLLILLAFGIPVRADGSETFQRTFVGEKTGEPMLALSSGDAAKYGKPTPEGFLFSLPKSDTPIASVGLLSQFRVHGDFEITLAYELLEIETPTTGYGSGASLFVVTASGDGAAVARCERPKEGSTYSTDRSSALGTGHDKHETKSAPTHAMKGKLRLIRAGTTLRYLTADDDGTFEELRRDEFVRGDLTSVLLLADPGMSRGPWP